MIELLIYLFPAGIALKIKEKYLEKEAKVKDYIINYMKYCTLVNLISYTILFIYTMGTETSLAYSLDQINFVFKYFMLSTIVAVFLPIAEEFIRKNIELRIELHEQKKKNTK